MKSIWIIGASTGIGAALVNKYVIEGFKVVASARSKDKLDELANKHGAGKVVVIPLDVTDRQQVSSAVDLVVKEGLPETIILNAGTSIHMNAAQFDMDVVHKIYDVNVIGVGNCLEKILPRLIERKSGHIALVASVAGYRGLPGASAYCSSKAAVINMAESLVFDLKPYHVDVTVINPGFVKTPLTDKNEFPMPCLITPEQAAESIFKGMQRRQFEITFPKRFTYWLKLGRILPYRLYFWLVGSTTKKIGKKT